MSNEGFPVTQVVEEVIDPQAFLAEYNIGEVSEDVVEAHGRSFTVAEALMQCAPFAQMIKGIAESLPAELPNRSDILKQSVRSMAATATDNPDAKKKF